MIKVNDVIQVKNSLTGEITQRQVKSFTIDFMLNDSRLDDAFIINIEFYDFDNGINDYWFNASGYDVDQLLQIIP